MPNNAHESYESPREKHTPEDKVLQEKVVVLAIDSPINFILDRPESLDLSSTNWKIKWDLVHRVIHSPSARIRL